MQGPTRGPHDRAPRGRTEPNPCIGMQDVTFHLQDCHPAIHLEHILAVFAALRHSSPPLAESRRSSVTNPRRGLRKTAPLLVARTLFARARSAVSIRGGTYSRSLRRNRHTALQRRSAHRRTGRQRLGAKNVAAGCAANTR